MKQRKPIYKPLQMKMKAKPEGTKNKTQWLTTANCSIIKKPNVTELLATGKVVPLRKLSKILMKKVVTIKR